LVCATTKPLPAAARRLPATVLDLHTGVFVRRGAAFDDLERAWVMRDRQQPAATA
ncbi:MAG: hypothetical protein IT181_09215, partial [Acidobacteria bacterium]|nr:hypothetical protein [Acidobacteriota bacterium]